MDEIVNSITEELETEFPGFNIANSHRPNETILGWNNPRYTVGWVEIANLKHSKHACRISFHHYCIVIQDFVHTADQGLNNRKPYWIIEYHPATITRVEYENPNMMSIIIEHIRKTILPNKPL